MDKDQFVVRTDGGVRIGTSGIVDGKVVLHVKQGKREDCILLERLIEKIHNAAIKSRDGIDFGEMKRSATDV